MVTNVTPSIIEETLDRCGLNKFTHEGIEAILSYYDSVDFEMVFNPADFTLWNEYGDGENCFDWDDFVYDYSHLTDKDCFDNEYLADLVSIGETVLRASNGNIVIFG